MSIVKSSTTSAFTAANSSIPYSYQITNTGNVTLTSAITVTDNRIASVSCPSIGAGLVPGASVTCSATYTTTQADVDSGGITNTASAKSGPTTSPTVSLTITATQSPKLSLVKATSATTYAAVGDVIPYTFTVTNSGNTTLTQAISVTDSKISSISCPSIGAGLAPAASIVCSANYSITQADVDGGNVLNTAVAQSGSTSSPTVTHSLTGTQTPGLTLSKASTTSAITTLNESVTYTYTAKNTGNVTLTNPVIVSDNKIASVTCNPLPGGALAIGASITCSATYTVTQADLDAGSVVNTASAASGTTTTTVSSNTTALTIPVTQSAKLALVKSAPPAAYTSVGQVVTYTFDVTNTGNVTATTPVSVSDNKYFHGHLSGLASRRLSTWRSPPMQRHLHRQSSRSRLRFGRQHCHREIRPHHIDTAAGPHAIGQPGTDT